VAAAVPWVAVRFLTLGAFVVIAAAAATACRPPSPRAPAHGGIAGQVRDRQTGEPVVATLTAHAQDSFAVASARTTADGGYAIERLAPGVYDMVVVLRGTTVQLTGIPVQAGRTTPFDVPVDLGGVEVPPAAYHEVENDAIRAFHPPDLDAARGRLEGTVTDSVTRERVAGAVVIATSPALGDVWAAVTDDRGRYRFPDGPPGTYTLSAFYQVARRGQIEVRRSDVQLPAGTALEVPMFVEVSGTR
jgi:hypothetical protein